VPLFASDHEPAAISAARTNAREAGVEELIHWQVAEVETLGAPCSGGLLLGNPPYGERIGERSGLTDWYGRLGTRLDKQFAGWRHALLVADRQLLQTWPRPMRSVLKFRNGGLAVELLAERGKFP